MIDPVVKALYWVFQFNHVFFSFRICSVLFYGFCLSNFSCCSYIVVLILFGHLYSLASCWASLRWLFWILHQATCRFPFLCGYLSFISFLWWCHVYMIVHDLYSLALLFLAFEGANTSSSLYRLVLAGKISCYISGCWECLCYCSWVGLEPGHVAAAGSTVSRPVTRSLGGNGHCLVPRKTGLPPGPWSMRLALGQGSTTGSTVGST